MGKEKKDSTAAEAAAVLVTIDQSLIDIALKFGVNTEGMSRDQLIESLNLNTGYQEYNALLERYSNLEVDLKLKVSEFAAANSRIEGLTLELSTAKTNNNDLQIRVNELLGELESKSVPEIVGEYLAVLEHKEFEPFKYEGNLYKLTDDAPKTIAFNDHVYTQEELLNDEDAMISLIVGENAFIKQIV